MKNVKNLNWNSQTSTTMVAPWINSQPDEPKGLQMKGFNIIPELLSFSPITGEVYNYNQWFIFAIKKD